MLRFVYFNTYLSVSLMIVFVLQVSMNTIVYIKFKAAQTYIAQEVCINRNIPGSTCSGKCYLKMQLKASDAKEKQIQSYSKDKHTLFCVALHTYVEQTVVRAGSHYSFFYMQKTNPVFFDIFHPPTV